MLDDRKLAILRAIVTDHVSSQEPVGSKALVERHNLGVSPATVRTEMAALEEEGYITQPHTSAGRVPTDKGYRLFVDRLSGVKPLSPAERRAITTFMQGALDLDDVVRLASDRGLAMCVMSTGSVEQRLVPLPEDASDADLAGVRATLAELLVGGTSAQAVERLVASAPAPGASAVEAVVRAALLEVVAADSSARVAVAGVPNLARYGGEYGRNIAPVLEALEEQVVLLRLLGEAAPGDDVTVRIGHENPYEPLQATSLVASGYGGDEQVWATLGIVGPTRMDYPSAIASVRAVARYVGRFLSEG